MHVMLPANVYQMCAVSLRKINIGYSSTEKGLTRETGFKIFVDSKVMAVLAFASSVEEM